MHATSVKATDSTKLKLSLHTVFPPTRSPSWICAVRTVLDRLFKLLLSFKLKFYLKAYHWVSLEHRVMEYGCVYWECVVIKYRVSEHRPCCSICVAWTVVFCDPVKYRVKQTLDLFAEYALFDRWTLVPVINGSASEYALFQRLNPLIDLLIFNCFIFWRLPFYQTVLVLISLF